MKQLIKKLISPKFIVSTRIMLKEMKRLSKFEKKIQTHYELRRFSKEGADTFFGYYDITPFNSKGKILYIEKDKDSEKVGIILNGIDNKSKRLISYSSAWNWQQGVRLRWMPDSNRVVSFNDFDGNHYYNRILNTETGDEKIVEWPLYDIDQSGEHGLSLNFERLGKLRPGYGYTCREYKQSISDLPDEGISIINISSNELEKKITYREISNVCNTGQVDFSQFYINHLSFSPSGNRFLFFWIQIVNGYHKASLVVYDIPTSRIIPLELELKASHYVWQDDDTIICTSYEISGRCRYYKYCINEKSRIEICSSSLNEDGHPSIYTKNIKMLTDTYPDKLCFQHIFMVDILNDEKEELIKLYSYPHITGEKRTDLHPRFNRDKTLVAFDANVNGDRSFYILNLKEEK